MKKATIIFAFMAVLLTGCKSTQASLDSLRAEISWSSFCAARGYDLNDNTYQPRMNTSTRGAARSMKRPHSLRQE